MSVCPAAWAVPGQGSNLALILPAWGPQAAPIPSWGSSGSSAGKGGSLHPTSHSAGGDPPALTEQWDFTLPTQGAGRSWHGLGAPCQTWGCPLPLCQELLAGQLGSSTNTPRMGQGSCKHTRGDGGDGEILGTKGLAGGQPSPEGSRVGRKHPCPVLALELGQNPLFPASLGTGVPSNRSTSRGPGGAVACRSPP